MKEEKVCLEVAELEFNNFCEAMDVDTGVLDEDDTKSKDRIVRSIVRGHLQFNDNGEALYTTHRGSDEPVTVTFHERTGATLMATDGKKKGDAAKLYAMMGDMCRVHPSVFAKMKGEDIKTCEAIFGFLMA